MANVAAVSLAIGYPTAASVPHSIVNGFKNLLAVAVATDITFKEAEQVSIYSELCVFGFQGEQSVITDIPFELSVCNDSQYLPTMRLVSLM